MSAKIIYRWCSCLLHNRFSVLFPCKPTQPSAPRLTEVRIISKIPGFTRDSWYPFDTRCCNTSKPLIRPEYSKVLTVSTARPQVTWKQEVAQSVRPLHRLKKSRSGADNAKKMRWCPIMHEIHVLFSMNKQIFQQYRYIIRKPMVYCTCWSVRQINWPICLHSALQGYPSTQSNKIIHVSEGTGARKCDDWMFCSFRWVPNTTTVGKYLTSSIIW